MPSPGAPSSTPFPVNPLPVEEEEEEATRGTARALPHHTCSPALLRPCTKVRYRSGPRAKAGLHSRLMTLELMRRRSPKSGGPGPASLHHSGGVATCPPGRRARAGSAGPRPPSGRDRYPGARSVWWGPVTPGAGACEPLRPPPFKSPPGTDRRGDVDVPHPPRPGGTTGAGGAPSASATLVLHTPPARGGRRASLRLRRLRAPPAHGWRVSPPRLPPGRPFLTWGRAW